MNSSSDVFTCCVYLYTCVCMNLCMYCVCMHVCIHACVYVCVFVWVYVGLCMPICLCLCMRAYARVCTSGCPCVCVFTYVCLCVLVSPGRTVCINFIFLGFVCISMNINITKLHVVFTQRRKIYHKINTNNI